MRILKYFKSYLLPWEGNNHKAGILHPSSLIAIKIALILFQVGLFWAIKTPAGKILGYAANISPTEVIRLTNEKRAQAGLSSLVENPVLSQAAQAKGADMLVKGYWAHIAPDGTEPWDFFANAGYSYRFAGENLARDFTNPSSAVDAWMASPSHRENLLSANYKEIGIGVVEGNLAGADTTIIVQFFGTSYADVVPQPIAAVSETASPTPLTPSPSPTPFLSPTPTATPLEIAESGSLSETKEVEPLPSQVLVSPFNTTRGVSIFVVVFLLIIMVIDAAITSRRRIRRIGGRTFAHLSFLGMILAIALILRAGQIL